MAQAVLFFFVALLYASVGFGGGSGYIAILSFTDLEPSQLRFMALCCNIVVVTGGTWLYIRTKIFNLRKILPFVATSVPAALIGGAFQLSNQHFFLLLAVVLLVAGALMLLQLRRTNQSNLSPGPINLVWNLTLGGAIGLISGLVGIGGGIFLAPVLHLLRWDKPKVISATASFFILVNSISGLVGQISFNQINVQWSLLVPLLIAVLIGGQIGSRLTVSWLSQRLVKALTAILVIFASIRMIYVTL
ncbi:MAG: sulfite exporter TauE/SafE family protein [Bacteroidia bacterium]|nr:sulfite exporter TauE/SafE family protein [Bacteroidia bacterium]